MNKCMNSVYLWGMPMITLSTPLWLDLSMMVLRAGMSDSQPSRPKRFSDDHFLWRNSSNLWTGGAAALNCGLEHLNPTQLPQLSKKQSALQLYCMPFQLMTKMCWGMWRYTDRPGGSDHPGQQSPLLLQTELHDSWSLKLLPDPLALLNVINEHKLDSDMLTVGHLEKRGKARYVQMFEWPNRKSLSSGVVSVTWSMY